MTSAADALVLSEVETGQLDVERAAAWLARCCSVDDVLEVHDRSKALLVYQRTRKASLGAQQDAAEIALRAERRLGEICAALTGGRGRKKKSHDATFRLKDAQISRSQSSRWQKLARIDASAFDQHVKTTRDAGERLTAAGTLRAAAAGFEPEPDGDEHYTPVEYLEAAREVMGEIELDPASCDIAQERVQALKYYTKDDDGLAQMWRGRTWLNPPFSRGLGTKFAAKLLEEFNARRVPQAVFLQNSDTGTGWFQDLGNAGMTCLPKGRIGFYRPDGTRKNGNRAAQVFFYLGDNVGRFREVFGRLGLVGELRSAA